MRKMIIGLAGGVTRDAHTAAAAARDNYMLLWDRAGARALELEEALEGMEEQFLKAASQAEQLLEALRICQNNLDRVTEEKNNASNGWGNEIDAHADTINSFVSTTAERDMFKEQLRVSNLRNEGLAEERSALENRIAELNTDFDIANDRASKYKLTAKVGSHLGQDGAKFSKHSLDIVFEDHDGRVRFARVKSLVATNKNKAELQETADHINSIVDYYVNG